MVSVVLVCTVNALNLQLSVDICFTDATNQTVRLICDEVSVGNDDCFSPVFHLDVIEFNTSQVTQFISAECSPQTIPIDVCKIFKNLRLLNVSSHGIPDHPLNCEHLEVFDASKNRISKIPDGFFYRTPLLKEINLSENKIVYVEPGTFSKLPQLLKLDLSSNQIEAIDEQFFNGMAKLEELRLDSNELTDLTSITPSKLPKLTVLSIGNNQISCKKFDEFVKSWEKRLSIDGSCGQMEDEEKHFQHEDSLSKQRQMSGLTKALLLLFWPFWFIVLIIFIRRTREDTVVVPVMVQEKVLPRVAVNIEMIVPVKVHAMTAMTAMKTPMRTPMKTPIGTPKKA